MRRLISWDWGIFPSSTQRGLRLRRHAYRKISPTVIDTVSTIMTASDAARAAASPPRVHRYTISYAFRTQYFAVQRHDLLISGIQNENFACGWLKNVYRTFFGAKTAVGAWVLRLMTLELFYEF